MAVFKCEICGGDISFNKNDKIAVCDYCGTKQTIFYFDDKNTPNNRFALIQKPDYFVSVKELVENEEFKDNKNDLIFALGKNYKGAAVYGDLEKLQHLLITGVSGYGKTNCLRSIIYSILYKIDGSKTDLLLIDPKKIEFTDFKNAPNLLVPIITDTRKAVGALGWVVSESLRRIQMFSDNGVRDIRSYNEYASKHSNIESLSKLVIVIDDFYQVFSENPKEVEENILKIVQNGRICGIHLVISSLQADRKFLSDKIKSSIPSKITFALSTKAESKYIIDRNGAENLSVVGDMLFLPMGSSGLTQIKCCYTSDEDVNELNNKFTITSKKEIQSNHNMQVDKDTDELGPLFEKAAEIIIENGCASTSFLQRRLAISYIRATKIIDQLEEKGIIGPANGAQPRKVIINIQQWMEMRGNSRNNSNQ